MKEEVRQLIPRKYEGTWKATENNYTPTNWDELEQMDKFFISAFAYLISLLIFWPSKTLFANFCLNIVRRILLTTKILFCTFFLFLKKIQKYFSVYEAFFFFFPISNVYSREWPSITCVCLWNIVCSVAWHFRAVLFRQVLKKVSFHIIWQK